MPPAPAGTPTRDSCKKMANFVRNPGPERRRHNCSRYLVKFIGYGYRTDEYVSSLKNRWEISRHWPPAGCPQDRFSEWGTYIVNKCCTDPSHISNYGASDFEEEFHRAADTPESVASALEVRYRRIHNAETV